MSIVTAIRGRLAGISLDAALAAGADPNCSPALRERARWLTSPRCRARVAARLAKVADESHWSAIGWSSVVPPAQAALAAAPALLRLAREVIETDDANPRGVALALELVSDGASPLYRGPTIDEVLDAIEAAEDAL
jgi:hypothetical protein